MFMTQETPVLEYSSMGLPHPNGAIIKLYENGRVQVVGIGTDFRTGNDVEGKILKQLQMPPERVRSFAERLVEKDFFGYEPPFSCIFDGMVETMTLNYQGRSRTIDSGNQTSPVLFPDVVRELESLVDQPE